MCRSAHQSLANYTCTHTTHTDTHKHTRTHAHTTRRWVNKFRKEAKLMTGASTSGEIWQYFLNKARDNLHIVLAMSPSGDSLRIRCRNFPGMVSQCVIDWFYTWPEDALAKVGEFFLSETKLPAENREAIVNHLVFSHQDVITRARNFAEEQRRFYYVTPKNYLDFLNNYISQLQDNRKKNSNSTTRLEGGLTKLVEAAEAVDRMQIELTDKKVIVDAKTKDVQALIKVIEEKTKVANVQQIEAAEKQEAATKQSEIITVEKAKAAEALMEASSGQV